MTRRIEEIGGSVIVYDDDLASDVAENLFELENWPGAVVIQGEGSGRGNTFFIEHEMSQWVLRHYHRGGLVGRFLTDEFLWLGSDWTRPGREWDLLYQLAERQLPVPRPVAARYVRHGIFYTADIITQRLPAVAPLSRRVSAGAMSPRIWREAGVLIGRFHIENVFHADLNAHNIQIDDMDRLYLLDFDRGRIMSGSGRWTEANLRRLRRSLEKITGSGGGRFSETAWFDFLSGYHSVYEA